jgi:ribosomal protein S18 acetylase RimI-like enzyme
MMQSEPTVSIINLPPERWEEFKNLRIAGLTEEYLSFARTPEEELRRTGEEWVKRCNLRLGKDFKEWFLAKINNQLVGCLLVTVGEPQKLRHVGYIAGMFVSKDHRREGVASKLLETAFKKLKENGALKVRLEVLSSQGPAVNLYKKMGFKKIAELKKEFFVNEAYYDMYEMEKFLK